MPSLQTNRGRKRAREARSALGLDLAAPLECLLTAVEDGAGLRVIVSERLPAHVAGACAGSGDDAVLWLNGGHAVARQRFTLAHELGHAWLRHRVALPIETFATLNGKDTSPLEIEANAFAAEFLVPRSALEHLMERAPTLEEVTVIAAHYGVSAIVVVYRVAELKLADATRVRRLEREVGEGLHHELARARELAGHDDRLAAIGSLPYLSPALDGTLLDAALRDGDTGDAALAGAVGRRL